MHPKFPDIYEISRKYETDLGKCVRWSWSSEHNGPRPLEAERGLERDVADSQAWLFLTLLQDRVYGDFNWNAEANVHGRTFEDFRRQGIPTAWVERHWLDAEIVADVALYYDLDVRNLLSNWTTMKNAFYVFYGFVLSRINPTDYDEDDPPPYDEFEEMEIIAYEQTDNIIERFRTEKLPLDLAEFIRQIPARRGSIEEERAYQYETNLQKQRDCMSKYRRHAYDIHENPPPEPVLDAPSRGVLTYCETPDLYDPSNHQPDADHRTSSGLDFVDALGLARTVLDISTKYATIVDEWGVTLCSMLHPPEGGQEETDQEAEQRGRNEWERRLGTQVKERNRKIQKIRKCLREIHSITQAALDVENAPWDR